MSREHRSRRAREGAKNAEAVEVQGASESFAVLVVVVVLLMVCH